MSDEEDPWGGRSEEEEGEEEEEAPKPAFKTKPAAPPPQPAGKTEAQLAMEKRRADAIDVGNLGEQVKEMLRVNEKMRNDMDTEIAELRARSERRKAERAEEEARLAVLRAEEDARGRALDEERRRKRDEEQARRREAQAKRVASFEQFAIKSATGAKKPEKTKEQLEAEKKAALAQRIQPLNVDGLGLAALKAKASELHQTIFKLETEKYDMEERYKKGQADMIELAERAKQIEKGGKGKAVRQDTEDVDKFQELFGAPPKVNMYSDFERQKDKRSYGERHVVFEGPERIGPPDRIPPQRTVVWGYEGPEYGTGAPPAQSVPEPELVPEPEAVAAQ